jgi:acetyl esterase
MAGHVDKASNTKPLDVRTAPGLDPVLRGLLVDAQTKGLPKLPAVDPTTARSFFEVVCAQLNAMQSSPGASCDLEINGAGGSLNARLYGHTAIGDETGAIVLFHGGGWVLGNLDTHDVLCRQLAEATGWPVLSIDYRLAPEHPFPAALDDARAALAWLRAEADGLNIDPRRIVVAGDSAGGNIAAALTLADRRNDSPDLFGQVLIYPVVGDDLDTESMLRFADGFGLSRADMAWFRAHYQGPAARLRDPLHCPLFADSLAGLPPAVIVTAKFDPLHDEGAAYADRLACDGTAVTYQTYGALNHGFLMFAGVVPEARRALNEILELARRLCGRPVDHG